MVYSVPFSYGPFSCVGKQVALQKMRLVMAGMVREFDAKLSDDFDAESFAKSNKSYFTMHIMDTLPVTFSRRQPKGHA